MARSLASDTPYGPLAAGAGAWVVVAAALVAIPAAPWVPPVHTLPAHVAGAGRAAAWDGAERVYDELDRRAKRLRREQRAALARVILEEAARAELTPLLVLAVIRVESGFDPHAVSSAGAVGLMQLMAPTLREELALARIAADPLDPIANVRAGVRYLARQLAAFSDVRLALVAYNAGPNRLRRHLEAGAVPDRLLAYPRDVLRELDRLGGGRRAAAARNAGTGRVQARVARAESAAGALDRVALCDGTIRAHRSAEEVAAMGRALEAARTRDLDGLFGYFGIQVEQRLVDAHREQIAHRFDAEVRAIVRLCARLRERERFTIVREALRLSYESEALRKAAEPT